jgi:hypothetical protein
MSSISPIEPTLTSKALSAVEQALQARLDAMMSIATGSKAESAKQAPGSVGVSVNLSARGARLNADQQSLQNAASFLQAQGAIISQMASVYTEISSVITTARQGLSLADEFLTGPDPAKVAPKSTDKTSILSQQFSSLVDTFKNLSRTTFGGVDLFVQSSQVNSQNLAKAIQLSDGTSLNVTAYNFSSSNGDSSAFGVGLAALRDMIQPTTTFATWFRNVKNLGYDQKAEYALAGMIVRNGSELLAIQEASDRMASYSVGNSVSLGSITDSNLAEDMTAYASSNIRLYASMAMMAQTRVRPTMAFSLITGS